MEVGLVNRMVKLGALNELECATLLSAYHTVKAMPSATEIAGMRIIFVRLKCHVRSYCFQA